MLEDQESIAQAIVATRDSTAKGDGVNSIVSILSLAKPATLKEVAEGDSSGLLQLVRAEMSEMRSDFRKAMFMFETVNNRPFVGVGSSATNFKRRISEARNSLREAEIMMENGAPLEIIVDLTSRSQKALSRIADADVPEEHRAETRHLFMMADNLERAAVSRQEKN